MKTSGRDEQAAYTPKVQAARNAGVNYVYNGSNDVTMIKMRTESQAQGLDGVDIWGCSLACYTANFAAAGPEVDGTYAWTSYLPFEDKGANEELDNYLGAVEKPDSFGANAWMAAVLFQQAVNQIVESDGPNGITRAKLIETLASIHSFDANGWLAPVDPSGTPSDCMVLLQLDGGEWTRVKPTEKGTFDCDPSYLVDVTVDPVVEAQKLG